MVREMGQSWGLWSIPIGHLEIGEILEAAAIRETKEETGYIIEITGKIETKLTSGLEYRGGITDNDKQIELNFFEGKIIGGDLKIEKDKHLDVAWFDKKEILNLPLRGDWLKFLFS